MGTPEKWQKKTLKPKGMTGRAVLWRCRVVITPLGRRTWGAPGQRGCWPMWTAIVPLSVSFMGMCWVSEIVVRLLDIVGIYM